MNLKQGDLENIILNALWDLESKGSSKIFVGDVQARIKAERADQKEWAYTTVKTVLDRLVDKELVLREKEGKKYFYRSLLQRQDAGFSALTKLLRQYFQNDVTSLEATLAQVKDRLASPARDGMASPFGQPAATATTPSTQSQPSSRPTVSSPF